MSEEAEHPEGQLPLEGAGQRLLRARTDAGMSIAQIAAETRIPQRHLEVIEAGDFAALPARTYAIGFSRTYARAVGIDEREIADMVRAELAENGGQEHRGAAKFEPGDPARIPSRGLAWFSAFAALILIVGAFAYFRGYFIPGSGPGAIVAPGQSGQVADAAADTADALPVSVAANPDGSVVFRSLEDGVWVKFYDANGERLMEKQLAEGEQYTVPADAEGPQIWTGQPEALAITIGGQAVPKLSEESRIIRDIDVTAAALLARNSEAGGPATDEAEPPQN